ncbi:MAG: bifunctional diguanylate cyclase/phosphodiesterase [Actinomycetia bacterium]|nr:bifunctional diguanylate cyclase/phosphodiesterase [Actinomycetes bacterium]
MVDRPDLPSRDPGVAGDPADGIAERRIIAPVVIAVVGALVTWLFPATEMATGLIVGLVAVGAIVLGIGRGRRLRGAESFDPTLGLLATSILFMVSGVGGENELPRGFVHLALALALAALNLSVWSISHHWLRARATNLLIESYIVGLAGSLTLWLALVGPIWGSNLTNLDTFPVFLALTMAVSLLLLVIRLGSAHDELSVSPILIALAGTTVLMTGLTAAEPWMATSTSSLGRPLSLVTLGFIAAAALEPTLRRLGAAVVLTPNNIGRSQGLTLMTSVVVGPILVGTCLALNLDVPLVTVAVGSLTVTALGVTLMARLLRAWGHIEHAVRHDELTGLANRRMFIDRVSLALREAAHTLHEPAVMFIDLDRFKEVNDTLGHAAGNELLIKVAQRLSDPLPIPHVVGRLSGDEFGVVLPTARDADVAEAASRELLSRFVDPFDVSSTRVSVTPSIGLAFHPLDGEDPESLLRNADAAMYEAKQSGRNTVRRYSSSLRADTRDRLRLGVELRDAVLNEEFRLFFQPRVCISTARVVAAEVLLRWQHPVHGLIGPDAFIELAEQTGVIADIGEWVIDESCRVLGDWRTTGQGSIVLSVNISPRQFTLQAVDDLIAESLRRHGADPSNLELELTESVVLTDHRSTSEVLSDLRAMGVKIAVDDFGTGYSSLSYLDRLSLDTLKIDREFVRRIQGVDQPAPIVQAVLGLGQSLGLTIVAEGVETSAQLAWLHRHGCDQMQGYLCSPPIPLEQFELMLAHSQEAQVRSDRDLAPMLGAVEPVPATAPLSFAPGRPAPIEPPPIFAPPSVPQDDTGRVPALLPFNDVSLEDLPFSGKG